MSVLMHLNPEPKTAGEGVDLSFLSPENARKVRRFHSTFREYAPTPLVALPNLARDFGLKNFLVKDESYRFGLNAFKALGASFAVGHILARLIGRPLEELTRDDLCSAETRRKTGLLTFASTTDGNHGRGVAWTARELGHKAIIYMPKGSARSRVDNILAQGAECVVTELNYDDTVRLSRDLARKNGWITVQDTAWEGYEEIPAWIMQGYMTLVLEALEQMRAAGVSPTHCFLQAGVGSFTAAVAGCLAAALGSAAPKFITLEPHAADCIYASAVAGDGKPHAAAGDLRTLMAGLACGEPSTVAWGILRDYGAAYMSVPDYLSANGMRILAAPLKGDPPVLSGESGAVAAGVTQWLMRHPEARSQREALGLNEQSSVLMISTEGNTDPSMYRKVVWFGAYPDESGNVRAE